MPARKYGSANTVDAESDYEPEPERGPLSAREANKLLDPLADLIADAGDWADRGLRWVSITHAPCDAFAFTDDECEKLAKIWIGRAKKSAVMARWTLAALDQWDVWTVGALLFGRVLDAGEYLQENGVRSLRPSVPEWMRPSRFRGASRQKPAAARTVDSLVSSQQPGEAAAIGLVREPVAASSRPSPSPSGKRRVAVSQADENARAEAMQAAAAARVTTARAPVQFAAPETLANTAPDEVIAAMVEQAAAEEAEYAESEGGA